MTGVEWGCTHCNCLLAAVLLRLGSLLAYITIRAKESKIPAVWSTTLAFTHLASDLINLSCPFSIHPSVLPLPLPLLIRPCCLFIAHFQDIFRQIKQVCLSQAILVSTALPRPVFEIKKRFQERRKDGRKHSKKDRIRERNRKNTKDERPGLQPREQLVPRAIDTIIRSSRSRI